MSIPKRIPRWADALWLALLAAYILAGAAIVPFHGDESTLIWMGRDYYHLFVDGDLPRVLYDKHRQYDDIEEIHRLLNGTISKTVYGWAASTMGFNLEDLNNLWNWSAHYRGNVADARLPDAAVLLRSRQASALQLALATAAFFQFVRLTLNRPSAYLASALFVLHPNVLINGRRAMMEGSHLLGLMLVLLAAAWLLRERKFWEYLVLGICAGFAISAKHHNVIAVAAVYGALALPPLWQWLHDKDWRRHSRRLLYLLAAGLVTILSFLLLNPAWWSTPLELPAVVTKMREALMRTQVIAFGGYGSYAAQIDGFFQYVFVGERQYFEIAHWAGYTEINNQIGNYEASGLAGILLIGESRMLGMLCFVLSGIGAFLLANDRGVAPAIRLLVLLWAGISALAALMLTPLPWARYYLPLLPALILLLSYALTNLTQSLIKDPYAKGDGVALLD
jgi:hypothetical protein